MADNVDVASGTGITVATKDIGGGVHAEKMVLLETTTLALMPSDATYGQDVDVTRSVLPTGAATETTLAALNTKVTACNTGAIAGSVTANAGTNLNTSALALEAGNLASIKTNTDKIPSQGQAVAGASMPVVLPAAQITTLTPPAAITGFLTEADFDAKAGSLTETAPATDTASSGINGRLQRIAQRITSLIALIPAALTGSGNFKVSLQETNATVTVASHAVTIASAGVASGAIASGAVASGAVASGAFASGSISDGAMVTLGAKTDAKSAATDSTSITAMQVLKQISASVQAPPTQAVTVPADPFGVNSDAASASGSISAKLRQIATSGTPFIKTALTPSSPTVYSVTASTTQALASNANRKGLVLTNNSANTISIGLAASAVLNSGITLYPGGVFVMDDYTFCTGAINAIASVTSSNLGIQEFT